MRHNGFMQRRHQGFTLLELMVVMFILVLLAGLVTVMVTKRVEEAKRAKAKADIETLSNAIDQFHLDTGAFPDQLDDLRKSSDPDNPKYKGPYIKKAVPNDPWEHAYVYQAPGEHNAESFDISSLGKDGQVGGTGNDEDIVNWD